MIMENKQRHSWQLVAEVELVYRSTVKPSERPEIVTPKDAATLLAATWNPGKIELAEQFKVLLLNKRNRVLGLVELSTGGITGTVADIRHIFAAAIKANSTCIIVSHNHPAGSLKPSRNDEELTEKIRSVGELLDIRLMDHIIITKGAYFSFAEEGLL